MERSIDDFSLTFHEGKVTDFSAAKGYDMLKELVGIPVMERSAVPSMKST